MSQEPSSTPQGPETPQKAPSSADASQPQIHRSPSIQRAERSGSQHRSPNNPSSSSNDKKSRINPHRNIRVAHSSQAIFDNFKARTSVDPKTEKPFEILLGKHTVIGPNVVISAEKGNIKIGDDNIISEGTFIVNKDPQGRDMIIGNGNFFECNSRVEAISIGNYNVFGAKSYVMSAAEIHNGCVIGPRVMVIQNKIIPDCMVVFGENMMHEQKLMLKRNRAYMDQMVPVMLKRFAEKEPQPNANPASGSSSSSSQGRPNPSSSSSSSSSSVKPSSSSSQQQPQQQQPQQQQQSAANRLLARKHGSGTREEKPQIPENNEQQ